MQRSHGARQAGWLRATLLAVVCLGGLAGCATLTDMASPQPGGQLDSVRAEVGDLRAAVAQLHAAVDQLGAGLSERDALLVQVTERLQALEKGTAQRAQPSGRRGVQAAMDVLPALNSLAQRLHELERRMASPEAAGLKAGRAAQPASRRLHLGMSQAEVRDIVGEPVSIADAPNFVFWHYGPERYVVFDRDTGRLHGWLGFAP